MFLSDNDNNNNNPNKQQTPRQNNTPALSLHLAVDHFCSLMRVSVLLPGHAWKHTMGRGEESCQAAEVSPSTVS